MLWQLLRTYIRPYRKQLYLVVGLQLVATIAALYLPSLNADIIDQGVVRQDTGYIWSHGGIMLAVSLVQVLFAIAGVFFGARAAMGFGRDVRHALFHQVTGYSAKEINELGAPSLITRITNDVTQVQMLVLMGCTMFVAAPITTVGGVIMALREDVGLSAILIFSIPALVTLVGLVVRKMIPTFRVMQVRIDEVNRVLREQITGMRVVRAFVREPAEVKRFGSANDDLTETSLTAGRLMACMFPSIMIVLNVSTVAAVWIGANRINSGDMQVGQMIAFLSYLAQILMSLMMATFMAVMIPRAAVCAERLVEVLETDSSVEEAPDALAELPESAPLELRNVGFHYPGADEPILTDISLTVAPGTTTAVIGSTGSGKTTLLNLIPRLFDVTAGEVLIGGVDIRTCDWRPCGPAGAPEVLFSGTVAPTPLPKPGAPTGTVAALRSLGHRLREGHATATRRTDVGWFNVSGGQRRRSPSLGRWSANLDLPVRRLVPALDCDRRPAPLHFPHTRDMQSSSYWRSTIMAPTRPGAEDGHCVGLGTHRELLASCPTYIEIVESQMTQEEAA